MCGTCTCLGRGGGGAHACECVCIEPEVDVWCFPQLLYILVMSSLVCWTAWRSPISLLGVQPCTATPALDALNLNSGPPLTLGTEPSLQLSSLTFHCPRACSLPTIDIFNIQQEHVYIWKYSALCQVCNRLRLLLLVSELFQGLKVF